MSALDQQAAVVTWSGFNSRTVTITNVAQGATIVVQNSMFNFGTTGAGATLACATVNDGSAYSDDGPSSTKLRSNGGASGGWLVEETWYLHGASAGTHNIVLTSNLANGNNYGQIKVHSVTGVQNAIPDFVKANAATSATLTTGNSTAPSQAGTWMVAGLGVSTNLSNPTWTNPATGFTTLSYDPATSKGPAEFDYQHTNSTSAQAAAWGTNSAGSEAFVSLLVGFKDVVAGGSPTITSIAQSGQAANTMTQAGSVTITGTNFGSNTGSAAVTLIDGGNSALQSSCVITAWSATSITFNASSGNVRNGAVTVRVTTSGGLQVSAGATLIPPTGTQYVTYGTVRALTFDGNNAPSRLYDSPDIGSGEQVEGTTSAGTGTATMYQDGNLDTPVALTQFAFRHHNGTQWSSVSHWDMHGLGPKSLLSIPAQASVNGTAPVLDGTGYFQESDASELPLTYTVSAGVLPTGQTLNASTGKTSGTLSATGTFSGIVIRAANASGLYAEAPAFTWTVSASPNVSFSGPVPDVPLQANAVSNPIDIAGYFTNATTFTLKTGSWPPGMSLSGSVVVGTPTGAGITPGQSQAYPVVVTGSNSVPSNADTNQFTLTVSNPAIVVPTAPTLLTVYSGQLASHRADPSQLFPSTPKNFAYLTGQNSFECADICSVGSADVIGTVYRYFRIPGNARVTDLQVLHDANSGAIYSAGVMKIDGLEPVSGSAGILFPATSFASARPSWTSLYQPSVIGSAPTVANLTKRIWELLGYTKDPSAVYEVVLKCVSAGNTAAAIALRLTYVS